MRKPSPPAPLPKARGEKEAPAPPAPLPKARGEKEVPSPLAPLPKARGEKELERNVMDVIALFERGDKIAMVEKAKWLSLDRVIDSTHPSIRLLRGFNQESLDRALKLMLLDFARGFSITNNLTAEQIKEVAAEIMVNYHHLKLGDIMLFLLQIKRGEYGVIYSLDCNKLLSWLREYERKRLEVIIARREAEHREMTRDDFERSSGKDLELIKTKVEMVKAGVSPAKG